jgi:signal transduction histidine kinase
MGRYLDGSGLGIYIVREIVRAHGGTVEVYSAPGQGARFVIRLPLLQASSRWLRLKAILGFSHRATDPTPPTTVGFQA